MSEAFARSDVSRQLLKLALISGAVVAAFVAPWEPRWFLSNFGIFWGPHLGLLLVLWLLRSSWGLMGGAAVVTALYLALFAIWVFSASHPESMAWIGYLFSFPGALLGAIAARYLEERTLALTLARSFAIGFFVVGIGIAANQLLVCSTMLYCGFGW